MERNWSTGLKNITITDTINQQLAQYYELIIKYNAQFNLTRITEETEVYYKHFYDALLISQDIELKDQNLCDVGTGLGVPGIVLKICFPELQLTLIESSKKKCDFLKTVVKELDLKDVHVVSERVEDFAHSYREIFDIVVARAVANIKILNELCLPLVKVNGFFVAYKGLNVAEEIFNIDSSLTIIGATLDRKTQYQLPNNLGQRTLLFFKKLKLTPLKYPRDYQQIKNKPL